LGSVVGSTAAAVLGWATVGISGLIGMSMVAGDSGLGRFLRALPIVGNVSRGLQALSNGDFGGFFKEAAMIIPDAIVTAGAILAAPVTGGTSLYALAIYWACRITSNLVAEYGGPTWLRWVANVGAMISAAFAVSGSGLWDKFTGWVEGLRVSSSLAAQALGYALTPVVWVGNFIKNVGKEIGKFFKGVYSRLPEGVRNFLSDIKDSIEALGEKFGIQDAPAFVYSHYTESLATHFLTSFIDTAVYIGSYKALKAMGLNNTWTNLLSGTILGGFTGFDKNITFEQGLIQGLALAGMNEADLDGWEYILGIALASGLGAIFDDDNAEYYRYENGRKILVKGEETNFFNSFFDEKVVGEILYRGIQKLGEALGLDPIYTMTTGLGIRSAFYHDPKLAALQAGVT